MFCRSRLQAVQWQITQRFRPVDICRYQEAALLCKMDYLALCDGAPGSEVGVWTPVEGWTLSSFLRRPVRVIWFGGESEATQELYVCVYGMCESQHRKAESESETDQAVFRECTGTNATEWGHIKVGICLFSPPAQWSSSFRPVCDLLLL